MLIDHANRDSWNDYIPVSYFVTDEAIRLGVNDVAQVDMNQLSEFDDVKLTRMAHNTRRVMAEYSQSI